MIKQGLDRKSRYTRRVLQESLLDLMKEKPVAKITIKELCENADINRTTFYAHYTDPCQLLRTIEDETLSWAEEMIHTLLRQSDPSETLKIIEGIMQYFADNRKQIQVLMSEQGDIGFQKQLLTLIYSKCLLTPSDAQRADRLIREYPFIFVVNGSIGLIQHWMKNDLNKPVREMAEIILHMAANIRPSQIDT